MSAEQPTVFGLPMEAPEGMAQPLEAAVVIKGLNADGDVSYWTGKTDGVTTIEVLGMMTWGADVALRGGELAPAPVAGSHGFHASS